MTPDEVLNMPLPPEPKQGTIATAASMTPDEILNAPLPAEPIPNKPSVTGLTTAPLPGWSDAFQGLADRTTLGVGGITKGIEGWRLAVSNDATKEEAKANVETQAFLQAQQHKEDYANRPGFQHFMGFSTPDLTGGLIAEQLPTLGIGAGAALVGAGAAAVVGAPIAIGALAGGAVLFGTLAAGQAVYDYSQEGVERNLARAGGLAHGVVGAAIAVLTGGVVGEGVTAAAAGMLTSESIKAAIIQATARLAQSMSVQVSTGELGNYVNTILKYIVTKASATGKPFTLQDAQDDLMKANLQTLIVAPQLAIATEAGGAVLGKINNGKFAKPAEQMAALQDELSKRMADIEAKRQAELYTMAAKGQKEETPAPDTAQPSEPKPPPAGLVEIAERKTLVDKAVLAVRVLSGAAKELYKAAEQAKKSGRELTESEQAALESKTLLNLTKEQSKEALKAQLANPIMKHHPWSSSSGYKSATVYGNLLIAFQRIPNAEKLARMFDTRKAVNHFETLHRFYDNMLMGHLEKSTGLQKGQVEILAHKAAQDEMTVEHTGADGKAGAIHCTADQAIAMLLKLKNEDAKAALLTVPDKANPTNGNNFSLRDMQGADSTEMSLRRALIAADPNYLKLLKGFESHYEEVGPILKAEFERLNPGAELELQDFYGGTIHRVGAKTVEPVGMEPMLPGQEVTPGAGAEAANDPRFTHERAASLTRIEFRGAFEDAYTHNRQQAKYEAFAAPSKLWAELMNSRDFHYALSVQAKGSHVFDEIKAAYEDTVHGKSVEKTNKFISYVMRMRTVRAFAFKLSQTAKHLTTAYQFLLYKQPNGELIPVQGYLEGMVDFFLHPVRSKQTILSWDEVKSRYERPGEVASYLTPGSTHPILKRAEDASMLPFVWGDKPALVAGAHAVYHFVLKKTGSEVMAKAEAIRAFQEILASGKSDQQSGFSRNQWLRLWSQFQQPRMRLAQHVKEADRIAANFPTAKNIAQAARVHAISNIAAALFAMPEIAIAAGMAAATGNDKEFNERVFRMFQDLRLGNMGPLTSDIATTTDTIAYDALVGPNIGDNQKHRVYDKSIAPIEILANLAALEIDFAKLADGRDVNPLSMVLHAARGLSLPIPETPIKAAHTGNANKSRPRFDF